MKIKRYFAPDIKQAIRMVREEQGPDAVILSNRKVDGGVEIVAARDFDEAMVDQAPGPEQNAAQPFDREDDLSESFSNKTESQRRAEEVFREALGGASDVARKVQPQPAYRMDESRRRVLEELQRKVEAPRARVEEPVRRREEPDYRLEEPSLRMEEPRSRLDEPSRRMEEPRRRMEEPPRRMEEPRSRLDEPPRRMEEPRRRMEEPPRRMEEPRSRMEEPPRRMEEPRSRMDDLSRRLDEPPRRRDEPRFGMEEPPFRMDESVRRMDEPQAPPRRMTNELELGQSKALHELQRELRQMRRTLDTHFSETAWDNASRAAPTRLELLRHLSVCGFSKKLSLQIANRLGSIEDFSVAWQSAQDLLASQLPIVEDNLLDYGGVIALVGPTGVGKTTTIAKLAARFRLKHGPRQIALVTTDNYRIGAHEQLSTYGRILDVPVRAAANSEDLRNILAGFYDKRLVLIDTAGMGPRDMRLAEQFSVLRQDDIAIKPYLVLSAASQAAVMREAIQAFSVCAPKACILTKLDEATHLGSALSMIIESQLPLAFISNGQQVPEDLHLARTQHLLEKSFAEFNEDDEDGHFAYQDWVAHANV